MKIIRDNLHGDIEFYPEEMRLLQTAGFERLHGCRQLGLSHLIYPGAKHSRFEHVMGVMHVASQIASRMKERGEFFTGSDKDELIQVLRFSALLHDMGHVPFGHTLEDEMPIITKHDDPSKGSSARPSRMDAAVVEVLRESGNGRFVNPVLQVLRAIAESKEDDRVYKSVEDGHIKEEFLVLADIIGNTICADLLDYIKRDHSMTGIRATYDSRIFQYFGVDLHKGHRRVVIQLVRNGRVRNDALADLLDILKLRYNLSDKVLFHLKKCAADSMLIRAVSESGITEAELMGLSDDGLLDQLRKSPLVNMIRQWKLYKPVFVCSKSQVNTYDEKQQRNDLIRTLHKNEALRKTIENLVEREIGLPVGHNSLLIFCPSPNMTLKSVRALVKWKDGTVRRLNEIRKEDDPLISDEVRMLEDIYPQLWKLYLFCEPRLRSMGKRIQEAFCQILEEKTRLSVTCDPAFRHYLQQGCMDYRLGALLDEQIKGHSAIKELGIKEQKKVVLLCHEQIPPDPYGDENLEARRLASRQDDPRLRRHLKRMVTDTVRGLNSRKRVGNT